MRDIAVTPAWALLGGQGVLSRPGQLDLASGASPFSAVTAATALAFFAPVGFEDSVNMAEETHDPDRDPQQYAIAGGMLALGVVLWALHLAGRALGGRRAATAGAGPGQHP